MGVAPVFQYPGTSFFHHQYHVVHVVLAHTFGNELVDLFMHDGSHLVTFLRVALKVNGNHLCRFRGILVGCPDVYTVGSAFIFPDNFVVTVGKCETNHVNGQILDRL